MTIDIRTDIPADIHPGVLAEHVEITLAVRAHFGQAVHVGGMDRFIAPGLNGAGALIVGEEDYDVGGGGLAGKKEGCEKDKENTEYVVFHFVRS